MHGKKKWIVAYDGRIKRSNNRTKIDYLREIPFEKDSRISRWTKDKDRENKFCPQCRYVRKQNDRDWERYDRQMNVLRERFMKTFNTSDTGAVLLRLRGGEVRWLYFYKWAQEQPDYPAPAWLNDWRNYVCFKCERKQAIREEKWYHRSLGIKKNYNYSVKSERRQYRNEVRHIMQNAKYVEDLYDDIPVYKRNWLD